MKNGVFLCFFGFFWKKGNIYMVFFWFFWFLIFVCDFWYLILMVKIKKTWKIWKKWKFDKKRCQKSYYKSIFLRFLFIFIFTINIRYQNLFCVKKSDFWAVWEANYIRDLGDFGVNLMFFDVFCVFFDLFLSNWYWVWFFKKVFFEWFLCIFGFQ